MDNGHENCNNNMNHSTYLCIISDFIWIKSKLFEKFDLNFFYDIYKNFLIIIKYFEWSNLTKYNIKRNCL